MARSRKAEREQVRQQLHANGLTVAEIAAEMGRRFNVRPRTAWRYALGWEQWRAVQAYRAANPSAPIDDTRVSKWESWPFGGAQPSPEHLAGLVLAFGHGCTVADLVDEDDLSTYSLAERQLVTVQRPGTPQADVARVDSLAASAAARETWLHLSTAMAGIEHGGIEHVQDDVTRLAKDFHEIPAGQMLAEARAARDMAYGLLERTRRPGQQSDLYLAAGIASSLLSAASFDVGQMVAAKALAKASIGYADLIDHAGLRAWSGGFLALVAYWAGRPRDAIDLLDRALDHAPAGTPTARLYAIRARAWGLLGDAREVAADVARSDTAFERAAGDSELQDHIGGEFGWRTTRHELCIGAAWVAAGDPAAAVPRIRGALASPEPDPETLLEPAHVDLAAADLAAGDLDAAADDLRVVWDMPVGERRHGLTGRFDRVRQELAVGTWRGGGEVRALNERIGDFVTAAQQHRALLAASVS
ncbi:hypothetical protein [Promicromonospora sp. NFX87]|uniref:hypothetical protein n=1 Tax=Promicromonospora sp. NFX87 TaxID=3402691 RepID=UPI003AFAFE7F